MKQVLQNLADGSVSSAEVPAPSPGPGEVLIATRRSLVSAGTERMLVEFGRKHWLDKARSQPDKVRQVLDKARTDGVLSTLEAVRAKLDQPLPLGYANAGVALEVGADVRGIRPGDRVVSNGRHAERVTVPMNLCARIPAGVSDDAAAFATVAAIGLQGIRLAAPTLGEHVAVMGLGLIGLLTVQLLCAQGCRVLGLDFDAARLQLAAELGAEALDLSRHPDPAPAAQAFARGRGVDAVLITAATDSDEPVAHAAQMCRQRGRIVLIGVAGLSLRRADFYEKELSFQVSCSYGPGRYDPEYEQAGHDYPFGLVRWTEQRNFEAVLDLMAAQTLDPGRLISHRFPIEQAPAAYDLLAGAEPSLGILLEYPELEASAPLLSSARAERRSIALGNAAPKRGASLGFIGTGNYAGRVLIPAFAAAGASLHTAVSQHGVSALHYGKKFGFSQASTDTDALIAHPDVDAVVIATRHASHARLAIAALRAEKHVFVEKPLCLTLDELSAIEAELAARPALRLMVGFNRRFSAHVVQAMTLLAAFREPRALLVTVNAGRLPAGHWAVDPAQGGGRIVGEACHHIDLLRHLAGAAIAEHALRPVGVRGRDGAVLSLTFVDGSVGTITYLANGSPRFPKERVEVFCAGRVLRIDNYRRLEGWGDLHVPRHLGLVQDKGQHACARAFVAWLKQGGPAPIPVHELLEVSRVAILAQQAALA
jgi:predicted dehydrogenase/threonine dehydrogenase-like Zn-dependent dehydrogenase